MNEVAVNVAGDPPDRKMGMVEFAITSRARKYGYIIWPARLDNDMHKLLGTREAVEIKWEGAAVGRRRVDWKYRRVSVGARRMNALPANKETFRLELDPSASSLIVTIH